MNLALFLAGVGLCCLALFGAAALLWRISKGGAGRLTGAVYLLAALALAVATTVAYLAVP